MLIYFNFRSTQFRQIIIGGCLVAIANLSWPQTRSTLSSLSLNGELSALTRQHTDPNEGELTQTLSNLTLTRAMQLASSHNRNIKLSNIAIDGAIAMKAIAGVAPNPTLTLQTAGINSKLGIGTGTLRDKAIDSTLRLDQVIERGNKRELRLENASNLESAARHDLDDLNRQTKLAVSFAYYDLLAAQQKLRVANEIKNLLSATQAVAEKRKKLGDIAGTDASRIRVDSLRGENDARQSVADLLRAQTNLITLLGLRVSPSSVFASDGWPIATPASLENYLLNNPQIIENRPDVLSAKAKLEAATAGRKLAIASRTRDLLVGIQFEHYPINQSNQLGSGNSVGISVQIPIFIRHEFQGEIHFAEAAMDAASENLEKIKEAAKNEMELILESARASQEIVQRFQIELLGTARHAAEAAEFAYQNGAIGVMDILDARRTYRTTEIDAINAQVEFAKAFAALHISTQR